MKAYWMVERRTHWDDVYARKQDEALSWHEDSPLVSLELLREAGLTPAKSVVDIGGGNSRLVDALVAAGQKHVAVLDLSATALDIARSRLGDGAPVEWIACDVTVWQPARRYDLWHDRAAFHFLTGPDDQ
jgi:trans-aconitate methyltransferase